MYGAHMHSLLLLNNWTSLTAGYPPGLVVWWSGMVYKKGGTGNTVQPRTRTLRVNQLSTSHTPNAFSLRMSDFPEYNTLPSGQVVIKKHTALNSMQ